MRDIKFRGKRLDNGDWVFGNYIKVTPYKCSDGHRICSQDTWDMHPVEFETVGQYTGLKDKNGKEIYEGDIVRAVWYNHNEPENEFEGKVIFNEGWLSFCIYNEAEGSISEMNGQGYYTWEIEVIGNI